MFRAVRATGQDEGVSKRLGDFVLDIQLADNLLDQSGGADQAQWEGCVA